MLRLQNIREKIGISQAELGRRAGIHPSDISRIESGRMQPYGGQIKRITKALGVSDADGKGLFQKVEYAPRQTSKRGRQ